MTERKDLADILDTYRDQLLNSTRKKIALSRLHPGCVIHFRRAAQTGPNADFVAVFAFSRMRQQASVTAISVEELDRLAARVTDEDVADWYEGKEDLF